MLKGRMNGSLEGGEARTTQCGYVALLGAPNVGKSTLMNALVGHKLAAVTPKAQTTWHTLTGIRTEGERQVIFLDTPGVLTEAYTLHEAFTRSIERARQDADVLLVVLDPTRSSGDRRGDMLLELVKGADRPTVVAVNKADQASAARVADEEEWARQHVGGPVVQLSAVSGAGLEELLEAIVTVLPKGPFLYPSDDVAAEPVRTFVIELIREVIFERFSQEVPYAVMPVIDEFREDGDPIYIGVTLYVERESQKEILIGRGGGAIRGLGTEARHRIEALVGTSVYLDLWVKVLPNWRRKARQVRRLGFELPSASGG